MVRQIIKNAAKPLRPRVEVYAKTEDGKIIAGKYPDGGVGVFGGGIDKGESPESAAKREFREEGGLTIKNVEKIKGVKPMVERWSKDHGEFGRKQKMRAKEFAGSKTLFMLAEVKGKGKKVDGSKIKGVKPRSIDELINQQKKAVKDVDEERREASKIRLQVLQKLREKTAEAIEESHLYSTEIGITPEEIESLMERGGMLMGRTK